MCNIPFWSFDAIALASVSHGANDIISAIIAFLSLRQLK